jgi:hypothetical protein
MTKGAIVVIRPNVGRKSQGAQVHLRPSHFPFRWSQRENKLECFSIIFGHERNFRIKYTSESLLKGKDQHS